MTHDCGTQDRTQQCPLAEVRGAACVQGWQMGTFDEILKVYEDTFCDLHMGFLTNSLSPGLSTPNQSSPSSTFKQ
jgi:hypothetical protein